MPLAPVGSQDAQLEQLREIQAKLDEEQARLRQLQQVLEHERAGRALDGGARARSRDVQNRIIEDAGADQPPVFNRASQNLAAAAILLRTMPEPSTPEGRRIRGEIKGLLEHAAVQQAESSASRLREPASEHRAGPSRLEREASVHPEPKKGKAPSIRDRLLDNRQNRSARDRLGANPDHGVRVDPTERRRRGDDRAARGYHPRRGGRYDSEEDRSPSPEPPGPQVFSRAIRRAPFPNRFRQPVNFTKYSGETKPELWLADYRLACQLGGADDDNLIIRNLPLFLSDAARAWLEHLPPVQIHDWDDLVRIFGGNFQGTYVRPGNSWDLRGCRQKPEETLREYIRRFSKQRTELPNITDSDVIGAFLAGTTCRDLVSKLGRKTPTKASELMDIVTKFASGQEAVEAIFHEGKDSGKRKEDAPEASNQHNPRKNKKKKAPQEKHEVLQSDLVAAMERRNPRGSFGGPGVFDKMLKEPCPYHKGPVKHTLEQCDMMRRYFAKFSPSTDGDPKGGPDDEGNDKDGVFPEVRNCFMIFGGPTVNLSARQRKQERREVFSVEVATPAYLDWSDKAITFDRDDHPDYIPNPGRYPLVVDPVIESTRLTKVLMDGGSSLNIIYAETLELMEISKSRVRAGAAPFHGITPGKRVQPLGQIDLSVCFGTPTNFRNEVLTFEVVRFRGAYHAVLGRPCYAKFMAIPNYTYLKLKMPGPKGVITVGPTYRHAYECDIECVEYAEALAESKDLVANLENLANEVPDPKRHAGSFEPAEAVKAVTLDPSGCGDKTIKVSSELDPK